MWIAILEYATLWGTPPWQIAHNPQAIEWIHKQSAYLNERNKFAAIKAKANKRGR